MKRAGLSPIRRRASRRKNRRPSKPSSVLMIGALAGLLGLAAGTTACTEDGPLAPAPLADTDDTSSASATDLPSDPTEKAVYNFTVSTTPTTYEDFVAACDKRGGFVQTMAACAANNACKGFSYLEPTLTEHSCKGLNNCGPGLSCVVLQKDSGRTGKEIYEAPDACASTCHGQFVPVYDPSVYILRVRPDTVTPEEAKERFLNGSARRLYSKVAFGVHGVNDDGTAYANMPPHYEKYSRAEIERVIEYVRSIPIQVQIYTTQGEKAGH